MARRKPHQEEELPFVALMDTMTNVVGVLIIVLVMIGIGLAKSVRKVLSELPPVTVEQHAKLEQEVTALTPQHDPEQVDEVSAKLEEKLKMATESLQTLGAKTEKEPIKTIDLAELQKQLAERKKERDLKKASVEKLLAEIDKLKAQLSKTPVYQAPPAVVVKMPNSRIIPEKSLIQRFLISGNRIIYIDEEACLQAAIQELKKDEVLLSLSPEKSGRQASQKKVIYDPGKVTERFVRQRIGTREIKLDVMLSPNAPTIPIRLTPDPNAGETVEQAKKLLSNYQALLRKFKIDSKNIVWFHVAKDSIETYLAAREISDLNGIPAGWELYDAGFFVRNLPPEYAVNFVPPPPAPPPPPPPPGPPPTIINIAPPKTTLD